ncbi:PH domain-containing protein [Intestinibacter sp.]|uniref:PH domain-containing protein n=1 Tax=Intestinibacter sp. TaxID=1965304 RepID=UPI002A915A1D|nr:PH domain-containing protein [Intestinibacter sp.]MDY5211341.1 PH domain-containing protein [Intestinibacter sp.]
MEKELWSDRKRVVFFGLPLSFTKYRLTTNRLFVNTGFLTQREDEVRLYRITDVSLSRTLMQRIFGLSTIHCNSSDRTLGNFDIINIKDGEEVKELLSKSVERERIARRVSTRENMIDVSEDDDWD